MATKIDLGEFANRMAEAGGRMEKAALRGVRSAAYRLEAIVSEKILTTKPYPPVNTGELLRSTKTTQTKLGATVSVDAPHAPPMEFGARPHMPPIEPLMEWAYQKGLADDEEEARQIAWGIAIIIKRWGLEPRHFMAKAIAELIEQQIIDKEIVQELEREGII